MANVYEVTYMEMAYYTVNVVAESEAEARSIVRSGECPDGYCTDAYVDEIGAVKFIREA